MERQFLLALALTPLALHHKKGLLDHYGSAREAYMHGRPWLAEQQYVPRKGAMALGSKQYLTRAEDTMKDAARHGVSIIFYTDTEFPERLRNCFDSPMVLYTRGETPLSTQRVLSIVGTRGMTNHGALMTEQIVEGLASYGPLIVSGMAFGIDSAAHRAALKQGLPTVAVLASGVTNIYPVLHSSLSEAIAAQGALISEYPPSSPLSKGMFVRRNRIVAGMADGVLVVESARKGGALITADLANSYNREVLAVPGRSTDKQSQGCNEFIKQSKAHLVQSANDIAYFMGWDLEPERKYQNPTVDLEPEERIILEILDANPDIGIDDLTHKLALPSGDLLAKLLTLEFRGLVKSNPGKKYSVC